MLDDGAGQLADDFSTKFEERMGALNERLKDNPIETEVNLKTRNSFNMRDQQVEALSAFESRVMVRGDITESPQKTIADNTGKLTKQLDEVLGMIKQSSYRSQYEQQIQIVGVN